MFLTLTIIITSKFFRKNRVDGRCLHHHVQTSGDSDTRVYFWINLSIFSLFYDIYHGAWTRGSRQSLTSFYFLFNRRVGGFVTVDDKKTFALGLSLTFFFFFDLLL